MNSSWLLGRRSCSRCTRIQELLSKFLLELYRTKVLLPILCFLRAEGKNSCKEALPYPPFLVHLRGLRGLRGRSLAGEGALSDTEDIVGFTTAARPAMKASHCNIV